MAKMAQAGPFGNADARAIALASAAMAAVVVASNILVGIPINDWLTWGALSYPFAFLVTDLTNRRLGPGSARRVAVIGFGLAVVLSVWLATPRIALASGPAFLVAQLLDIAIFDRLRQGQWWRAPLISSALASAVDTLIFFWLAFADGATALLTRLLGQSLANSLSGGEVLGLPWQTWALGDLGVKLAMAVALLLPFGLALSLVPARREA